MEVCILDGVFDLNWILINKIMLLKLGYTECYCSNEHTCIHA